MTWKPCPGCGSERRRETVLCTTCADKIKGFDDLTAQLKQLEHVEIAALPERGCDIDGLYGQAVLDFHTRDRLRDALLGVLRAVAIRLPDTPGRVSYRTALFLGEPGLASVDMSNQPWQRTYGLPVGMCQAFTELQEALRQAFAMTYNEAKQSGLSLLRQLAEGEISPDEFSDKAAKRATTKPDSPRQVPR